MATLTQPLCFPFMNDWLPDIWSDELQIWLDMFSADAVSDPIHTYDLGTFGAESGCPSICSQATVDPIISPDLLDTGHIPEGIRASETAVRGWIPYLPDTPPKQHKDDTIFTIGSSKQGGRRMGPLNPATRNKAKEVRKISACWRCKIYRQSCDEATPCRGCMSRSNRIWRRPCNRIQLQDLSEALVPGAILNIYSLSEVRDLVTNCVSQWSGSHIEIHLRWAPFAPTLRCAFQHFIPTDNEALSGVEMWYGYVRQRYRAVPVSSPPVACPHIDLPSFRGRIDSHLNDVVENDLFAFFEVRYGKRNRSYLLTSSKGIVSAAIYQFYIEQKQDPLLKQALKLLILTCILCRVIRVDKISDNIVQPLIQYPEDPKETSETFWRVSNLGYSTPTLANYQIKMVLSTMVNPLLRRVLSGLQKAICRGQQSDWASAAAVLITLALVTEQFEVNVHVSTVREDTQPGVGTFTEKAAKNISETINDDGFGMLLDLYAVRFKSFVASIFTEEHSHESVRPHILTFLRSLRSSRDASANPSVYPAEICPSSDLAQYVKCWKPKMWDIVSNFENIVDRVSFRSRRMQSFSSTLCEDGRILGYC